MSVVVNEFEVVTAPGAVPPAAGSPGAVPGASTESPGPWAALQAADAQRHLAERAARLAAT